MPGSARSTSRTATKLLSESHTEASALTESPHYPVWQSSLSHRQASERPIIEPPQIASKRYILIPAKRHRPRLRTVQYDRSSQTRLASLARIPGGYRLTVDVAGRASLCRLFGFPDPDDHEWLRGSGGLYGDLHGCGALTALGAAFSRRLRDFLHDVYLHGLSSDHRFSRHCPVRFGPTVRGFLGQIPVVTKAAGPTLEKGW